MNEIRRTVFSQGDPDGGVAYREFIFDMNIHNYPYDPKAKVRVKFDGAASVEYDMETWQTVDLVNYPDNRVRAEGQLYFENRYYGGKYCFSILKFSGLLKTNSWVNTATGTALASVRQSGVIIGFDGLTNVNVAEQDIIEVQGEVGFVPPPLDMTTCVFTEGDPGGGQAFRVFAFESTKAGPQDSEVTVTITVDSDNLCIATTVPVETTVNIEKSTNRVKPFGSLTYKRINFNGSLVDAVFFSGELITNSWISTGNGPMSRYNPGAGSVIVAMYDVEDS
ncbi:MAG: hypothetical protein AB8B74_02105 [Crocinitomicaceae bacterium]